VREEIELFQEQGVQPVGVNPASAESHARYSEKMGFPFPLLSDPEREIAAAYGALKPDRKGIQRSVIGIAEDGRVAYAVRGAPPVREILGALDG
jgi:peroxiredoxin Q/BCP